MKANLLQKNKNILRFPVISKVNSSKFQLFSISFKSKNFQTSQNPQPATYPTPPEVSKYRFETKQLLLWFQNSVLVANKTDGGFPTTKGNLRMPQRLPRSRLLPLSRI